MRNTLVLLFAVTALSGCAYLSTNDYTNYVETAKSISRDNTVSQTACWNAIAEIAKSGDPGAKVGAIALADRCKNEPVKLAPPKKGWLSSLSDLLF